VGFNPPTHHNNFEGHSFMAIIGRSMLASARGPLGVVPPDDALPGGADDAIVGRASRLGSETREAVQAGRYNRWGQPAKNGTFQLQRTLCRISSVVESSVA
jgi:hypothetical protein